jgi:DHA3 family macrolide efflux protein-like MFS transporter
MDKQIVQTLNSLSANKAPKIKGISEKLMETQASQSTFRHYLLFWMGQLVSLLGSSIVQFVLIWWITLETGNALWLALASFLGLAPMVIIAPFAGVLVDRWNRKILIGVADFLQAFATILLIILFLAGIVSLWHILVLLTVRGIFQAFHSPAVSAIIPLMVPKEKLSRMNGLNYLCSGAVNLFGPVFAALMLGFWAIHQILWIDVATFLVALFPLLMITIPAVRMTQDDSSFKEDFLEGFGFVKKTRGLLPLLTLATALNFLLAPISTLLPYYVKFDHLGNAPELALVMAFFQGGILAGGVLMSLVKGFKKKMVVSAISLYIVFLGYVFIAFTPKGLFWFMALSGLLMAFCLPIVNVLLQTIFQTIVPLKMQGRVNSVIMALASAATPIGMILSGAVVEFIGTANLFLGCAIIGMLAVTLSWLLTDIKYVEKAEQSSSTT